MLRRERAPGRDAHPFVNRRLGHESIQATSLLDWLESNSGHPDAAEVRGWRTKAAEQLGAERIGWAIVAGRKAAAENIASAD